MLRAMRPCINAKTAAVTRKHGFRTPIDTEIKTKVGMLQITDQVTEAESLRLSPNSFLSDMSPKITIEPRVKMTTPIVLVIETQSGLQHRGQHFMQFE